MQNTTRVLGLLALAATVFATSLSPDEVKTSCEKKLLTRPGLPRGMFRHPLTCDKFLNCAYKPGSTLVRGIEVACPTGHYFNEELKICLIAGAVPCKLDPCLLLPNEVAFTPHPFNCNKYFKCSSGVSQELCCPSGIGWDKEYNQCLRNGCQQSCHEEIQTESKIAVGNVKNSLTNCLKFDFSTAFSALKNVRVELVGVQRVAGSLFFESGNFFRFTYYQRMEWNNEFVLTINFKVIRHDMDAVLITNGDRNHRPTLHVGLHNDDVTVTLLTHGLNFRDRECTLTAKADHIKNWTRVTVAFAGYRDGKGLTLKTDKKSRHTPCTGDLELALNPFVVGKGLSGYMNDLQLCGDISSL